MSNTLDLIEEKPLISIQELSQKLSVSIRTIRRWNSEAQKMDFLDALFTYMAPKLQDG